MPAGADGERLLHHHHPLRLGQRVAHLVERERAEALEGDGADRDALVAHLVDHVLDRAQHRAERQHQRLGVVGAVAAHEPAGGAAEGLLELVGELRDHVEGLHLLGVHEVLHLGEGLGPHHRADRDRVGGVELLARLERRQVGVDLLLASARRRRSKAWVRMKPSTHTITGSDSSSASRNACTCRSSGLLVALGVELDPARVALGHRVAVVVPDVDRRADRPVGHASSRSGGPGRRRCRRPRPCRAAPGWPWRCRSARRWPRTPIATDMAANSDSTLMYSHGERSPRFTIAESPSTMCVWGEIG